MHSYNFEFASEKSINHTYIKTSKAPLNGMITEASMLLINTILPQIKMNLKQWRKEKKAWTFEYELPPGVKRRIKSINYNLVSRHIRENSKFDPNAFNLPDIGCSWLDQSTSMNLAYYNPHGTGNFGISSGDLQTHHFGEKYPIKPVLTREGRLVTTIQPALIRRIIAKRLQLISDSNKAFSDDWIFDLRNLISDVISLVDIVLNQLYVKAEYLPLPGWKFDKKALGNRHGRRMNDKLKWVSKISGKNLNIEKELPSLDTLRELRNHFMHFDPPTLVITWEEATIWLNQIIDIGKILIQIRQVIGVNLSYDLVNFILQEEAIFVPFESGNRHEIDKTVNENYRSSTWPEFFNPNP